MKRLVVKSHNPRGGRWLRVLLTAGIGVAIGGAYFVGEWRGGYERVASSAKIARLQEVERTLAQANAELRQQVVFLKRARDVDRIAQAQVQKSNAGLQAQVSDLKTSLSFYRDIMTPAAKMRPGVQVQALTLIADDKPGRYHYSVVLMQAPRHDATTKGTIELAITGKRNGDPATLHLGALDGGANARPFRFRYFQDLQGDLALPADFAPEQIKVVVHERGSRHAPFTRTFNWQLAS